MSVWLGALLFASASAHESDFGTVMTFSDTRPSGASASVENWVGAAFDADNIGGSGVNADGGSDNGVANDAYTYVAHDRPVQGQSFQTGGHANGYQLHSITVQATGYTNNNVTSGNYGGWNLYEHVGPILLTLVEIDGSTRTTIVRYTFKGGGDGNPGSGSSANGSGKYITFEMPSATYLDPNATYGVELAIGNGSSNHFEWLGSKNDNYAGGTAYSREWWGGPLTPHVGDRVFLADMSALAAPAPTFAHPGTLHSQSDLDLMAAKVAAGEEPWLSGYNKLLSSPYNNLGWPAYNVDYIVRDGPTPNNYTRSQQDAQLIYTLTMIWHLTGDTAYADRAVYIANTWSDLIGIQGNSNASLAAGICGYLFAVGGDLLSTYPGWQEADQQAYQDMMMRVFYPANLDFLWRHHDTAASSGGNTHYRLNWETANMASMAAIGILCDNRAVYEQAVDFFKYGPGNGRVERAAWYVHPGGLAQGEEAGRDQAHNMGGWHAMALLCQMAWNQGDDLFGYDNNRVLRAFEYNAKYNLWNDVDYARHRNSTLSYTEGGVSGVGRGIYQYYHYELVYNHYANVKGIAAPWSEQAASVTRPEPWPDTGVHPSQVDWFGLGTLTYSKEPVVSGVAPSNLVGHWSQNQITVNWNGTAGATSYDIQRATTSGGPYTTIGSVQSNDLYYIDSSVTNGTSFYYVVTAHTPSGSLDSPELEVSQKLVTHYNFEGNAHDQIGSRDAELFGGSGAVPGYVAGHGGGQAIDLDGLDDYVKMPVGTANYQDITLAAWVYWDGGSNWQRVFGFGSDIEKTLYLTPSNGGGNIEVGFTTTRWGNEYGDAAYRVTGPAMPVGTWTHLAFTLDGDTMSLYVNGELVDTEFNDLIDPLYGQPFCYLGRSMYNFDPRFNGRIDDFQVYNYALSSEELTSLSGGGGTGSAPSFSGDTLAKSNATEDAAYSDTLSVDVIDPDSDPLSFSKLWGPAWISVAANGDLTGTPGNEEVGLNTLAVRVTDGNGNADEAIVDITVLNANDAPTWNTDPITFIDGKSGLNHSGSLASYAEDIDAGETLSFSKISGPSWLHVANDGSLSGTPDASDQGLNSFSVRVTDMIGATADATLNISVDLIALYNFEGNVNDAVGLFDGTAAGSPLYSSGKYDQAVDLDGTDDYLTIPAGVANLSDLTIATWVNWDGGSNWQRIFDFGNNTSEYLYLTPSNGGTMRFGIKTGGVEQVLDTTIMPSGQWVHVAVTLDGDTGTLYVNGSPVATNNTMTINPADFNPAFNYIGNSQWPDPLLDGRIDDFRIYNHALSETQLNYILRGGSPVPISLENGDFEQSTQENYPTGFDSPYDVPGWTDLSITDSGVENVAWWGTYDNYSAFMNAGDGAYHMSQHTIQAGDIFTVGFVGKSWDGSSEWTVTLFYDNPANVIGTYVQSVDGTWTEYNNVGTIQATAGSIGGTLGVSFVNTGSGFANLDNVTLSVVSSNEPDTTPPAAPTGLAAMAGDGSVDLDWDGNTESDLASYTVYRSTSSGSGYASIASGLASSAYTDSSVGNGTTYYYVVTATDTSSNESISSAEVLASPQVAPPSAPTGLGATAVSTSQIDLSWTASSGASSYHVKRASTSGGPYTTVATGETGTSYSDSGLSENTTYYYVVSAVNAGGESADSLEASATTQMAPPSAPTGVGATAVSTSQIDLSWTASSGASSYHVKRASASGGPYTSIATGETGTSYSDSGLSGGATYYYVVSAVNAGGESADSLETSATTQTPPPSAPTGLTASTVSINQIDLSWTASADADSYNVKWASVEGGPYSTVATDVTDTSYQDIEVLAGTTNYYVVSAVNIGSESADSSEASATTPELVADIPFDETSGTTAFDLSPNAFNGTLLNGAAWTQGLYSNALELDGIDDSVTLPMGVNSLADFTIHAWIYLDTISDWQRIFDFGTGQSVYMFLSPQAGSGFVRYSISTSGPSGEQQINGTAPLPTGAWVHVAVTLEGNLGTLYVAGSAVGTNPSMTLYPGALGYTDQNYIGRSQFPDPYLDGAVDELQIIGRALSASEIATLATPPQISLQTFQAEDSDFGGGAAINSNHGGHNGSGFINMPKSGGYVELTGIDGGPGGTTMLDLRYALGAANSRTGLLIVNGVSQNITATSSGSWSTWSTLSVSVSLQSGTSNTIRIESNGDDWGNLDEISIGP